MSITSGSVNVFLMTIADGRDASESENGGGDIANNGTLDLLFGESVIYENERVGLFSHLVVN